MKGCYSRLVAGLLRRDDWLTAGDGHHPIAMTLHSFIVTTTLGAETIVWQLMAITAAAAINTALEFTGPGASLVRCTKETEW